MFRCFVLCILIVCGIENDQSDESSDRAEAYNLNVKDTDGDGLEDGYEIWDFKTLWNTETGIDEEGNKTYDLYTDDYGDANLNKKIKYFYDANGNNTAIVEQYDSDYVSNDSNTNLTGEDQVICVTYTYDSENNVTFICDQSTTCHMMRMEIYHLWMWELTI